MFHHAFPSRLLPFPPDMPEIPTPLFRLQRRRSEPLTLYDPKQKSEIRLSKNRSDF